MSSRNAYVDQVVGRATEDPEFRAHLLKNPKAAVESELGIAVPPEVKIRVVEESPAEVYVVLPPDERPGELSDDELAGVAGGAGQYPGPYWMGGWPTPNG